MKFEVSDIIKHPVDQVFPTFRDHIAELAQYLPNIETITILDRQEECDCVHVTSHWLAKVRLPGPASKLIPEKERGWDDIAIWNNDKQNVDWKFVFQAFPEAIKMGGTNSFIAEGDHTRLHIKGEAQIDYNRIPGVPNFVLKRIVPTIEKIAFTALKPNLLKINRGVEKYLSETQTKTKGKKKTQKKTKAKSPRSR